ncbi:MAG: rod shape-determining protein MreC [Bacilli bacterium]
MDRFKLELKHIVLIILLILTIFLAIFTMLVDDDRKLTPVEQVIKDGVILIQKAIYSPFLYIDRQITKFKKFNDVYKENEQLKANINQYNLIKSENDELKRQIEALKKLLDIDKTLTEYTYLNATVINRNIGYWYNSITIDKGSYHGISKDMIVINHHGLVGKVIKTTNFTSEVKLITTNDLYSKISVGIEVNGRTIHGLISGYDSERQLLIMDGVVENVMVTKDALVYTTGLGGIFPSGILVGRVVETAYDEYGLSKNILVESEVDFNNLYFVTILKRKA